MAILSRSLNQPHVPAAPVSSRPARYDARHVGSQHGSATGVHQLPKQDTLSVADALCRELKRELGADFVFMDHRNLEPGKPYPANLEAQVRGSTVLLSLVGSTWLTPQGEHGVRRLDKLERPTPGNRLRSE